MEAETWEILSPIVEVVCLYICVHLRLHVCVRMLPFNSDSRPFLTQMRFALSP